MSLSFHLGDIFQIMNIFNKGVLAQFLQMYFSCATYHINNFFSHFINRLLLSMLNQFVMTLKIPPVKILHILLHLHKIDHSVDQIQFAFELLYRFVHKNSINFAVKIECYNATDNVFIIVNKCQNISHQFLKNCRGLSGLMSGKYSSLK